MPKISVIMGAYNCANEKEALTKSIDSILNQTFSDIELIVCEDGSTDDTYRVLNEICVKDMRISLIRNEVNKGLAYSLNHCLMYAKGEYVARQDADDYSDLARLETEYEYLETNPGYAFVSSNIKFFSDEVNENEIIKIERPQKGDFLLGSPFVHPSTMFRKSCLEAVNGYRAIKITRRCEDYDLFMRIYAAGMKGYNIQKPLHFFKFTEKEYLRRRKYNYYLEESIVRFCGFHKMGILFSLKGFLYALKPAVVGLIPSKYVYIIHKNRIKKANN